MDVVKHQLMNTQLYICLCVYATLMCFADSAANLLVDAMFLFRQ